MPACSSRELTSDGCRDDAQDVWDNLELVAYKHELEPVSFLTYDLNATVAEMAVHLDRKVSQQKAVASMEQLGEQLAAQQYELLTKADAVEVDERHELHAAEAKKVLAILTEQTAVLVGAVSGVERRVRGVADEAEGKASGEELDDVVVRNESMQEQVRGDAAPRTHAHASLPCLLPPPHHTAQLPSRPSPPP